MATILTGIKEDSTCRITGTFVDEAGTAIPAADLSTVKMWLYDEAGTVINSRTAVNILNAGPGAVDSGGNLVLTLTAADNPIVSTQSTNLERHLLVIEWTWNTGAKKSHENIYLHITDDYKIPTARNNENGWYNPAKW